jgi:CelD/BcsL family acetyltransferase involved in cellulose biosynthesis
MNLTDGNEAYFSALKERRPKFVADTLRKMRKLETSEGEVGFVFDAGQDSSHLDRLICLKRAQYARTGVDDVFARPQRRALIDRLMVSQSPYCRMVLQLVTAAGAPIAYHLGLRCKSTLHYWFPTYEPRIGFASPGRLILWKNVEEAARHGVRLIDLGAGDSQAKRQLSNGTYHAGKALWCATNPKGFAARSLASLRWRLERHASRRAKAGPSRTLTPDTAPEPGRRAQARHRPPVDA